MELLDRLQRPLRDVRVSVTDRCNFRCRYCMPREAFGPDYAFREREELLTYEEIARLVKILAGLGVRKVRLTGGEPLLRRNLERLVGLLAGIPGIDDVALTTNGSLLAQQAEALAAAGLQRVTVSLDTLDPERFRLVSDTAVPVTTVLDGIAAARGAGLAPIKINAVVQRGRNDGDVLGLVRFGRKNGYVVRFIEYMDVGTTNGWQSENVVSADELLERIDAEFPLEALPPQVDGEVATRYRFTDGGGEIGIVPSVTKPFCGTCSRARLSASGELFTCLFASRGTSIRDVMRSGGDDDRVRDVIRDVWGRRSDRYSELRGGMPEGLPRVEMSAIGG